MSTAYRIAKEAADKGIKVELLPNNVFRVYGFSKSGYADINDEIDYSVTVKCRYKSEHTVIEFDGLAEIAYDWYKRYRDVATFSEPDPSWLPVFIERGWVTVASQPVYTTHR
jgi:hypothetical protein